ncbi:MAG: hypothetical protein A2W90_02490 [Bacteroidetes bacterium GWF2_42_66]|nr:MAG: hypothetical protein A2W92_16220 [Bacteroidetes bacterium GWA2_42_15]OFY01219.1 MAG: hypothetical protein A2W89_15975 [Bacteroidetes bacterium GWE2_42_39]OFY42062.1 MAG: hypothetical protein A2W90_02490 [Bacteroidetes bacterium GWF2_42_66]
MKASAYAIPGLPEKLLNKEFINAAACEQTQIPISMLRDKTRVHEIVLARQLAMHYRRTRVKEGPCAISRDYNVDHATVTHAVKTINNLLEVDKRFAETYAEFENRIKVRQ